MTRPVVHTARGAYRFQPVTFAASQSSAPRIDLEGGTLAPVAIITPSPWPTPGPRIRFGAIGANGGQAYVADAGAIVTVTPVTGGAVIVPALPYFGLYLVMQLVDSQGAPDPADAALPVTVVLVPR